MGAKTTRPNNEPVVIDPEGGLIGRRGSKVAKEVPPDAMDEKEFQRISQRIDDALRDSDTSLTRATRDRDRATPRDVSNVASTRLRGALPADREFRAAVSGRQRKQRSALKNHVINSAPESQRRAMQTMLTDEDATEWRRINWALHKHAGNVQELDEADRVTVQRLDRLVQSYERNNDRSHRVYVSVRMPDRHGDVNTAADLPSTLAPGAIVEFDQFTLAHHNLHETHGHDSNRYVVLELVTSRGMYMGRSDSVEDTTHLLPRGMRAQVVAAEGAPYALGPNGFGHRLVVQLQEVAL